MVRGNYQRRIEAAEARKIAAKQRKQRRDNRGTYKQQTLGFFSTLEKYDLRSSHIVKEIHVWVDSAPADSPPLLDMQDSASMTKGKAKSKKGRGRSNSMSTDEHKKKAHPRSKEAAETNEQDAVDVPQLCRHHFFSGKCLQVGKKGSNCPHVHLPQRNQTLAQVVKSHKDSKETLLLAEEAIVSQQDGEEREGGLEMMYHLSINVDATASNDENPLHISDLVSTKLSQESVGVASVVYLAIDNNLVFDRYRGGALTSETELRAILQGDVRRMRSSSVFSDEGNDENDNEDDEHVFLPAHVLEYILMFLPDQAVSTMSFVCEAWHQEIGQHSPDLWRRLLARRSWPMPKVHNETEANNFVLRDSFRSCFIRHYTVVRDVEAVRTAAAAITAPTQARRVVEENEFVFETFSARRLAPQRPNGCIATRVWSDDQVLAAYSDDCSLRLFKAVAKSSSLPSSSSSPSSPPRACREIVSVSVDPFRNTKRHRSRLVAMDLDEDVIGCVCHILGDEQDNETYILSVVKRDDYLFAAGNLNQIGGASLEEGKLQLIDVGEAILNFLLSCDDVDHRLLRLFDFLSDGGDISDVEVLVSQSVQACGYGRFMVEVAISIPTFQDDGEEWMSLVDRKLVLISASAGAIVWMGGSVMADEPLARQREVTMASFREVRPGERRETCSIAFVSSSSPVILAAELDASGEMSSPLPIEAAPLVRRELLEGANWQMQNSSRRPVAITPFDIVVVDSLFQDLEGGQKINKSIVSFYPRFSNDISYATLTLEGNCQADRLESIHDGEYVVVLCRVLETNSPTDEANDGIDGQWFGVDEDEAVGDSNTRKTMAVIIHVPSRKEIHRACLFQEPAFATQWLSEDAPIFFTPNANGGRTIGVGLWWEGIIMTGSAVREVGAEQPLLVAANDETPRSGKKQKKKKRQQGKGGKKDGYARGMSLRG